MKKYILTTLIFLMSAQLMAAPGRATARENINREAERITREINDRSRNDASKRRDAIVAILGERSTLRELAERVGTEQFVTFAMNQRYGQKYMETMAKIEQAIKQATAEQGDVATQFKIIAESLGSLMVMQANPISNAALTRLNQSTGVKTELLNLIFKNEGDGNSVVRQLADGGMLDAALMRTAAENADLTSIYQRVSSATTANKALALVEGLKEVASRRLPEADRNNVDKINEKLEELINQLRRCIS